MNEQLKKYIKELLNHSILGKFQDLKDINESIIIDNIENELIVEVIKEKKLNSDFIVDYIVFSSYGYSFKPLLIGILLKHTKTEDWTIDVFKQIYEKILKYPKSDVQLSMNVLLHKVLLNHKDMPTDVLWKLYYYSPWIHNSYKKMIEQMKNYNEIASMILDEMNEEK